MYQRKVYIHFNEQHNTNDAITFKRHVPNLSRDEVILAEVALQVELVRYSQITGDPKYEQMGNSIIGKVANASTPIPGLYSTQWSRSTFMPKNGK
jgi:mannosyl-oligosaccharide alpha-1,2-mannosidase